VSASVESGDVISGVRARGAGARAGAGAAAPRSIVADPAEGGRCAARRATIHRVTDLLAARALFGVSLAFHIVFAAVGVAMPLLMVLAEWRWRRTGSPVHLELARRWAKGTAILFAVGAVSGTVISFELGLLWPRFMAFAGPIIGMPFSLEGFAFFAEAIFLGIYLYGWERASPALHLGAGVVVAASGALSAFFVTLANAWMNVPAGFRLALDGGPSGIRPFTAMFPPGWEHEVIHVLLSCYAATGLAVAGIHAYFLLRERGNPFHRAALRIALGVGAAAALLQPLSGDLSARQVARTQPVKLAALEGQFETERGAPLRLGGLPDPDRGETRFALEIPRGLSILAFHDPDAVVQGLHAFPRGDWPNVRNVHLAFQVMVGLGSVMALVSAAWVLQRLRGREPGPRLLRAIVLVAPAGFLALEAGWLVTEWGRQPFTIHGIQRTADAVTPVSGLLAPFLAFTLLYLFLAAVTVALLGRQIARSPRAPPDPGTLGGAPAGRGGRPADEVHA
jgi:cytochrome bd ubiquinol oxidase subunit I